MKIIIIYFAITFVSCWCKEEEFREIVAKIQTNIGTRLLYSLSMSLEENHQNILVSPFFIYIQLAMYLEGSRGKTREEILRAVFSLDKNSLERIRKYINKELKQLKNHHGLTLDSKLFIRRYFNVEDPFRHLLYRYYKTTISQVNFSDAQTARKAVHEWAERITGTNSTLSVQSIIEKQTNMLIMNLFSFHASWKYGFPSDRIHFAKFYTDFERTVSVLMMHQTNIFNYAEITDMGFRILEMPYNNGNFSMFIFLPDTTDGLENIRNFMVIQKKQLLLNVEKLLSKQMIALCFPKFQVENVYSLHHLLFLLDINELFEPYSLNLQGITRQGNLYNSHFLVWNRVKTTESGSLHINRYKELDKKIFCVNHPFIYFIRDNEDGNLLLLGQIINPANLS